jgi:hypothetical protein
MKTTILLLLTAATAMAAPPTYKVINKIKIGGAAGWDYVYLDSENHRLYVSHQTQTEVIDTATDKLVGTMPWPTTWARASPAMAGIMTSRSSI